MTHFLNNKGIATVVLASGLAIALAGCNVTDKEGVTVSPETVGVPQAGAPPEVTDPNKDVRAYVRVLHLVPEAGAVTLMLDGKAVGDAVTYESVSDYTGLGGEKTDINSTGKHSFTLAGADGQTLGSPLEVDLTKGEDVTIVVSGTPSDLTVTPYKHTAKLEAGQSRLALLYSSQLGPNDKVGPTIDVMLDDKMLQNMVKSGEGLDYQNVAPGAHTLKVMAGTETPLTKEVDMIAEESYTAVVYKDAAGKAALKLLNDKFVPTLVRAPSATTETTAP